MQAYGEGGLRAARLGAIERLARLYWHTVEFGLIDSAEGLRIYGAGIVSSHGESLYALESPSRRASPSTCSGSCAPATTSTTTSRPISSSTASRTCCSQTLETDFAPLYRALADAPDIEPGEVIAGDRLIATGGRDAMTRDLFDNPLGTDGFEFVEFTSPEPERLKGLFEQMGFAAVVAAPLQERAALRPGRHQLHPQHGAGRPAGGVPRRARPLGQRHGVPGEGRRPRR